MFLKLKSMLNANLASKFLRLALMTALFFLLIVHLRMTLTKSDADDSKFHNPTIFCIVLTTFNNLNYKTNATYETWAKSCDNFKFVLKFPSNLTENNSLLSIPTFSNQNPTKPNYIELNNFLEPAELTSDVYKNLTVKISLSLSHIYQHYPVYDWYVKADDDTFVIVSNLRRFVRDKDPHVPISFGYNFDKYGGYHSGGAGYLLSREALRRLGRKLTNNTAYCYLHGVEDVDMGFCLRQLGIQWGSSIDELGRERFHPLSVHDHFKGNYPPWMYKYAQNKPKKGLECCSDSSISFHYMSPQDMIKMHAIINELNDSSTAVPFQILVEKLLDIKLNETN